MAVPSSLFLFLRRFAIAFLVVVVVSVSAVVAGNALAHKKYNDSKSVAVPNLVPAKPGHAANYLLIGSDTRAGANSEFGNPNDAPGQRSDVMMVLHVEPNARSGVLVSFPRDLMVTIPGHGRQKLNATYGIGGPPLVIDTLQANFPALKINHYIEVDFKGFQDIVDAIGGVKLYFPTPAHDPDSGLNVDKPGCVSMNGAGALAYARSRHYFIPRDVKNPASWDWNYDAKLPESAYHGGRGWKTATGSDLERIPRQQYFLRTLAKSALDKTASDPTKLFGLLDAVKNSFTHDNTLKFGELQALVRTFNRLDPARVDMETLPVTEVGNTGAVQATDASATVIGLLKGDDSKTLPMPDRVAPANVTVKIANGAADPRLAQQAFDAYKAAGYHVLDGIDAADRTDYDQSQVRFAPGKYPEGYWSTIALGTINVVEAASRANTVDADVLVVVGNDYNSLKHEFPGQTPASTTPTSSSSTASSTGPTTTTTLTPQVTYDPQFVPVDPSTNGPLVGCPAK